MRAKGVVALDRIEGSEPVRIAFGGVQWMPDGQWSRAGKLRVGVEVPRAMDGAEDVEDYRGRLLSTIVSCQSCQPWENGPVWVIGKPIELEEAMDNCGVPLDNQDLREAILSDLVCPGCGDSLSEHHDVGVKFDFEIAHERAVDRAKEEFGERLWEFSRFLEKYPMLGANHEVGSLILKGIQSFPKACLEGSTWFRARRIENGRELDVEDMRVPDPERVAIPPGRFNHLGQAHWYLASSEHAAAREVLDKGEAIVWMQRWTVERLDSILDLVVFGPDDPEPVTDARAEDLPLLATAMIFGDHLNRDVDRRAGWRPEYFIPVYVADAAKHAGFKGIRFTSTRSYMDVNLVLFSSDAPVKADGRPFTYNVKAYGREFPF